MQDALHENFDCKCCYRLKQLWPTEIPYWAKNHFAIFMWAAHFYDFFDFNKLTFFKL